ncbi:MAG: hypothetical protein JW955_14715, partial [Sedimentisphaerales bacterium]|nr:hypothetical protein [Sedimentisphaerales bacterium]
AQMDKVTQQNAANAEESASASEELSAQAESMHDIVAGLVSLVGGASQHKTAAAKPQKPAKGRSLSRSDRVLHEIAEGQGPASPKRQSTGNPNKSLLISLGKDEEGLNCSNK